MPQRRAGDTSELAGRTFLVTGGNTGIGRATAQALAARGGRVWIAARSRAKGEAAVAAIKASTGNDSVGFLPLDLADLDSVQACANAFLGSRPSKPKRGNGLVGRYARLRSYCPGLAVAVR